jgi:hypothetical protein
LTHQPTTAELKASFERCGLWRHGWTYDKAMAIECVRKSITSAAIAHRRKVERKQGKPLPVQPALI